MNAKDLICSWSVMLKPTLMIPNNFICRSLPHCNECYRIFTQNGSSNANAHWVVHCLVTACGKSIKTWLPGTAVTVAIMPTGRQLWVYSSDCQLAWALLTASPELLQPAPLRQHRQAANIARIGLGKNLHSTSCNSCSARVIVTAEKLGRLPTRCPLNPACSRPSALAFGCTNSPF
jgi:hypothetical protein